MVREMFSVILAVVAMLCHGGICPGDELLPQHINAQTQKAIKAGLDYLAQTQLQDGNWGGQDGAAYPTVMAALGGMAFLSHGDTPSRGPYADNIHRVELYLLGNARPSGLITSPAEADSRSMYGHGFSLLFLSTVYGMETDPKTRDQLKKVIINAIDLTSRGQGAYGGWTYIPGGGDEGSVTVTQMQGLRAASNAGFTVPKGTVEGAREISRSDARPRRGESNIRWALRSGPRWRFRLLRWRRSTMPENTIRSWLIRA